MYRYFSILKSWHKMLFANHFVGLPPTHPTHPKVIDLLGCWIDRHSRKMVGCGKKCQILPIIIEGSYSLSDFYNLLEVPFID